MVEIVNEKLVLLRGRRPWLVNSRIDGNGRACQRPRTSSDAKCFSCEGALAREIAYLNFWQLMLRLAERVFSPSKARAQRGRMERGDKKPRGRGLGQRNRKFYFLALVLQ